MSKLGDYFTITSGGTPNKKISEYYQNGSIPWVKTGDLKGKYVSKSIEYITELGLNNSSAKLFPKNTVLVAMYGATIGACSILPFEASTNQACAAFLPSKIVMPTYLYYFLSANKEKFIIDGVGGAQPNISAGYLKNFPFNLIPLTEQETVCKKIDEVTHTIDTCNAILEKLDLLVKSRFIELFGELSVNPWGYPVKNMSDIAEYWNGLTYKPEDVSDTGTIVLRSSNIQNMQLNFEDTVRVNCKISDKKFVQNNDILMCSRNGSARLVGKVALIKNIDEPMSFGAFMMIIRSEYYPYLMTYFQLPAFRSQITTGATTTINQITVNMMNAVRLPVPDKKAVAEFARFVEQTDKTKQQVKMVLEKAETLKKALMQEYFG